jgi:hypothetical protein
MQQTIAFLEGAAVKHFVRYARVGMINIAKIRSKTLIKGQFATQWTQFLVGGLLGSLVLARLHLSQALKMRDKQGNLIRFLLVPYILRMVNFVSFLTKRE